MDEFYRSEIRSVHGDTRREERSAFMAIVDALATVATVAAGTMMALTLFVPYVATRGWLFPILGLIAPATYVATVCLMLYWIIRWRWFRASVMILLSAAGLFFLNLFLKPEFRKDYGLEYKGRDVVSLMTYNVRQFIGSDKQCSRDSLLAWVRGENPDILCMQEFVPTAGGGTRAEIDSLFEGYYATGPEPLSGNVIYSRFRILRWGRTSDTASIRSIWADLLIGGDTVRLFNNHLHSTQITSADDEFLSRDNFLADTAREEKMRSIVRRFRDNSIARAAQADTIARTMAASPYPRVVCGDFNDTPMSYVYHTMAGGLRDAFSEAGRGYSFTYLGFRNALRIDFALFPERYEVLSYRVPEVDYSDHRPVVVKFRRRDN